MPALSPPDPELLRRLHAAFPKPLVLSRAIDRLARASDASMYRIVPEVVVRPRDIGDVKALLEIARATRRGLTFRTAGTSLSGQAVGAGILVDLSLHWGRYRLEDQGLRVWAEPGVLGGTLNRALAPFARRIGPDPASIDAAMIGGIVANNSSGMCCGVEQNSYRTLAGLDLLLADGTRIDAVEPGANQRLRDKSPRIAAGLLSLRDELRADLKAANFVRKKFATKNTMGYSLNAFLDYTEPADILSHLVVGSEGTLAFIAGIALNTVPDPRHRATSLAYFKTLRDAGRAISPLADAGAAALEIMDTASLRLMADEVDHPVEVPRDNDSVSAILIEFQEADETRLRARIAKAQGLLDSDLSLVTPADFSTDETARARKWRVRKGLLARAGASRGSGLAILNEDIAVPRERLAEAIPDLHRLFAEFGVKDAVVFGHAKDGNLHFIAPQDFRGDANVSNFDRFLRALADLIVGKYQGALKAEHGAGRNMAPFVKLEFGERAYGLMRSVKDLLDPYGILNPGVKLSDDPSAHITELKAFPIISKAADHCIECGFCERVCPSRTLTLTPRQRITVQRELRLLDAAAHAGGRDSDAARDALREVAGDYLYDGVETCARDSMCGTVCPVKIDTSQLVKELDAAHMTWARRLSASIAARSYGTVLASARAGLGIARALPRPVARGAANAAHALAPRLVPRFPVSVSIPRPAEPALENRGAARASRAATAAAEDDLHPRRVVYFSSCVNRVFGPDDDPGPNTRPSVALTTTRAVIESLRAVRFEVIVPPDAESACCGMSFSSQAQPQAARIVAERTADLLFGASERGQLDVVTDASPCALTLQTQVATILGERGRAVRFFDFPTFWARVVLPNAKAPAKRLPGAVLHPTCSSIKAGSSEDFRAVAAFYCDDVTVPLTAACCGFAGDRGFFTPELTEAATRAEAEEVKTLDPSALHCSTCRTCEIGMTRATGRSYLSLAHLVHAAVVSSRALG